MNENLKLDEYGEKLLHTFEGKRNRAYQDIAGIWTIGNGLIRYTVGERAGRRVQKGDYLTDEEIHAEFRNQIKSYEGGVKRAVKVPLTQSQFNACVSLAYNIGVKAFAGSTVVRELNQGKYQAACRAFALWNKAGGRVSKGLSIRRKAEQQEFFRNG